MLIGYSRCSSATQHHATQIDALERAGCERIFQETESGTKADRIELAKLMEQPWGYYNYWMNVTVANDVDILTEAVRLHDAAVDKLKAVSKTGDFSSLMVMQAMPSFYSQRSIDAGGNTMGLAQQLPPGGRNAVNIIMSLNPKEPEIAELGHKFSVEVIDGITEFAKKKDGYVPWKYYNYSDKSQNPLEEMGSEAYNIAKAASLKYDPKGFFQNQSPLGFKITKTELRS